MSNLTTDARAALRDMDIAIIRSHPETAKAHIVGLLNLLEAEEALAGEFVERFNALSISVNCEPTREDLLKRAKQYRAEREVLILAHLEKKGCPDDGFCHRNDVEPSGSSIGVECNACWGEWSSREVRKKGHDSK